MALLRSGDTFLDIGAHIGYFSFHAAWAVGRKGKVFSFEPNPPIFDFLSHNVRKLRLPNVELFKTALSDHKGCANFVIPRYRWGSECHYDATLEQQSGDAECRRIEIAVDTLDSIFADRAEKIAFIKCDVNNHELSFLRGALQTIRRSKPAMLIEILADPDQAEMPAAQVFDLLAGENYQGYWFDGEALHKRKLGERSQNYFFLTPEHLNELPSNMLRWMTREYT